jgi:hypothetical protein
VDEDEEKPTKPSKSAPDEREARLAAALRANLRRRKGNVREPKR